MADEPIAPVVEQVVAAPPAEAAPVPAVEAVAAAPAVEAVPAAAPAAAEAPLATDSVAPAAPTDLLKQAVAEDVKEPPAEGEKPPAEKPAEPAAEVKPPEADKPAEPAADPAAPQRLEPFAEYKYELPEDLQLTDERRASFHTAIEDARNGDPQPLIDLHREAMQEHHERMVQRQRDQWNTTLEGWQKQTESDPDVGGTKFTGISRRVAQMRDNHVSRHQRDSVGWKSDMEAFNHMLDSTGVGNHPAMWKFLNNLAEKLGEPAIPAILDPKPASAGKRNGDALYTHERSPRPNGPN